MPRRIPDYPDAFTGWNQICSIGSIISLFATGLFFYIVFDMFRTNYIIKKNNPHKYYPTKEIIFVPSNSIVNKESNSSLNNGLLFLLFVSFDAPRKWQMNFQAPASPVMEKIVDLHHDIQFFLIVILIGVLWVLLRAVYLFIETNTETIRYSFDHHTEVELIWTLIPTVILIFIAIPSFALLYAIDELHNPKITLKVLGNQWYWSYEFADYIGELSEESIDIDSYMLLEEDLISGQFVY